MDEKIKEIKEMQEGTEHRSKIENEAYELIVEGKFIEAIELLNTI